MDRHEILAILARQDGVITRAQALACQMSPSAVGRLLRSGEWIPVETGVYQRADRERTPAVELRAAVYGAGFDAVASGPSACWWHGLLDSVPDRIHVTVPRNRYRPRSHAVSVRRRDLPWKDTLVVRHLPVTALPLTVLETAVVIPGGTALMDRALQRHTTLAELRRAHERNAGRHGTVAAARLLDIAESGGHSEAERLLLHLLRKAGLDGWRIHVRSCGFEIDVAFEKERVAIEVDGWRWHRDPERFRRDTERQNILVNAGWHVLRFTWHTLNDDPEGVIRRICEALARRR